MKVELHNNEVRPLIKEGYEKVYDALTRLLAPDEIIFAQWKAGFGDVLQWTLPDNMQWRSITQADSFDRQAVIDEFLRMKSVGEAKLGKNKRLVEAVYSVPSEACVYYTIDHSGRYRVMLAGWGYAFPFKPAVTNISHAADVEMQDVVVKFIENGQPVPSVQFDIPRPGNRILHFAADAQGEKSLGSMAPGSRLTLYVPSLNRQFDIDVVKNKQYYTLDLTVASAPVIPHIPEITDDKPEDVVEPEETIIEGRRRDIAVRFVGYDGNPLPQLPVILTQTTPEIRTVNEGIDENGYIYLDHRDFTPGIPIRASIPEQQTYPDADFIIDPIETEYEIYFTQRVESNLLGEILMWTGAALVAAAALIGFLEYNKYIDIL